MDLIVSDHLASLRRRGLAPGTIEHRRLVLGAFATWLDPVSMIEARTEDVEAMLDSRRQGSRTRYCWVSHLHGFYDWAIAHGRADRDPTALIQRPKLRPLLPRPASESDLEVALGASDRLMSAWIHLSAYAGLRCAEIAALDACDVLDADMSLRVLGKGHKERVVPMHPKVLISLRVWGVPRSGPLFRRPRGGRYPAKMVSREMSLYLASLGLDITAHQFRHRFATRALEQSCDLRAVQELLGHSSPTTTAIYTKVTTRRLRAVVDAIDTPGEAWQPALL